MQITIEERKRIQLYLKEPVTHGLWLVDFLNLDKESDFYNFFHQKIKDEENKEETVEQIEDEDSSDDFSPRSVVRFKFRSLRRITRSPEAFINFIYQVTSSEDDDRPSLLKNSDIFNEFTERYRVGLEYFFNKFPKYEEDEFDFSGRRHDENYLLIDGAIAIPHNKSGYVATSKEPLLIITQLMKEFGINVNKSKITMFFSPEEEIIKPYFHYTALIADDLFYSSSHRIFKEALNEYEAEEFENCIAKLGKASEEILIQIYETLFRNPLHEGLTIGQLYDRIRLDISNMFRPVKIEKSKYKDIHKLLKENSPNYTDIIRGLTNMLINDQKYIEQEIKNKNNDGQYKHLFPKQIRKNIDELIRYRNAASHKSREYLGEHEALKMLYDFVSLYLWWKSQYDSINWDLSKDDIIKDMVQI